VGLASFKLRYGRTLVSFGPGSVESLASWLSRFKRVYVVAGRSAARVSGALDDVEKYLRASGVEYEVFSGVFPNPTASLVDSVAELIWRYGAEAVVAVGGGSTIDVAKIASVVVSCGGRARDYLSRSRDVCDALPLAAVNLTHGTGSEVDRYAVATIEETHEKVSIASEYIYPSLGIDDPRYLVTLPRVQTVYTSLDAFYHAIESSTSKASSPFTRSLAEEVVRLISRWLPVAVSNPADLEARYWLLYASLLAGIAVDNSRTHMIHALEHVLSGLEPRLAHGAGLAALGPSAIEFLYREVPEVLHRLLRYLDPSLRPDPEDSGKAAAAVRRFQAEVEFSESLLDYGFTADRVDEVVSITFKSLGYLLSLAPLEVGEDLVRRIYLNSLRRY